MIKFVFTMFLAFGALTLVAQDDKELQAAMKTAGGTMGGTGKAVATGMMDVVSGNAAKMVGASEVWVKYFTAKNMTQAAAWSKDAHAAAMELEAASKAGDADKTKAAFGKLGATCKTCHAQHREKLEDGSYKLKM